MAMVFFSLFFCELNLDELFHWKVSWGTWFLVFSVMERRNDSELLDIAGHS